MTRDEFTQEPNFRSRSQLGPNVTWPPSGMDSSTYYVVQIMHILLNDP